MATGDFYTGWFGRSATITPPTPEERQRRKMDYLRNLAASPLAQELVERFDVPEVTEAEAAFKQALAEISDPETRNRVDMAAGRISLAYQLLGFCVGHTAQSSEALIDNSLGRTNPANEVINTEAPEQEGEDGP